jgi:Ca2+-binding EF-hand superfamily protein
LTARIDAAELGELLDELGAGYDTPQVSAAFEAVDIDHDGQIESREFAQGWLAEPAAQLRCWQDRQTPRARRSRV